QTETWMVYTFTPLDHPNTQVQGINTNIDTTPDLEERTVVADVNGDGFDDIIFSQTRNSDQHGVIYAILNGPDGLASTWKLLYETDAPISGSPAWLNGAQGGMRNGSREADFDGDGRSDLIIKLNVNWVALISTGSSTSPQLTQYDV